MRTIVMVMLAVQAASFLVTAFTMLTKRSVPGEKQPVWFSLILMLVLVAGTSWNIGDRHFGEAGVEILLYVSALLMGMAIMAALMAVRRRRGLDAAS